MQGEPVDIRGSFVDAYPRYVASLLGSRGVQVDDVLADAIVEGAAVLDGLLATLESIDPLDQVSSPLELFREALRPIDRALTLLGTPPPKPGSGATRVAPWDRYALSPGSSQVLGPLAQEAHIAWGLRKAQALTQNHDPTQAPAIGFLVPARDIAGLVREAEAAHYRTVILPNDTACALVVVCADESDAVSTVREASKRARVIVYGRSIDDMDQTSLTSLGATSVFDAESLLGRLAEHLPVIT
jgi:hypothetical protein